MKIWNGIGLELISSWNGMESHYGMEFEEKHTANEISKWGIQMGN
jgi:hypothetical protein